MKQEEKELLLKDLCARLPYMPKLKITYQQQGIKGTDEGNVSCDFIEKIVNDLRNGVITDMQIYLRPMSSMTEEEKEEFHKLKQFSVTVVMPNGVSLLKPTYIVDLEEDGDGLNHLYDWLNAHHFDYRGLIEKDLAIEAPEGMYN